MLGVIFVVYLPFYLWVYFAHVEPIAVNESPGAPISKICLELSRPEFAPIHWIDRTLIRPEMWEDDCD